MHINVIMLLNTAQIHIEQKLKAIQARQAVAALLSVLHQITKWPPGWLLAVARKIPPSKWFFVGTILFLKKVQIDIGFVLLYAFVSTTSYGQSLHILAHSSPAILTSSQRKPIL